jgi:hypothetical protein
MKNEETKQLTREQAIAIAESKVWENWNDEQVVRFQLFQKYLCMPFDRFHQAIEKVLNRPVYTHEFGMMSAINLKKEYLGVKDPPTFEEIIDLIPKNKQMIIQL